MLMREKNASLLPTWTIRKITKHKKIKVYVHTRGTWKDITYFTIYIQHTCITMVLWKTVLMLIYLQVSTAKKTDKKQEVSLNKWLIPLKERFEEKWYYLCYNIRPNQKDLIFKIQHFKNKPEMSNDTYAPLSWPWTYIVMNE